MEFEYSVAEGIWHVFFYKLNLLANIPKYAHNGDAGFDFESIEKTTIEPGKWKLIKTGLAVILPNQVELQIRSRSGLALKKGISVLNAPGTIDSGYRGEIGIILMNNSSEPFNIEIGDRIAQGVLNWIPNFIIQETKVLDTTERGSGGFGSTGINNDKFVPGEHLSD